MSFDRFMYTMLYEGKLPRNVEEALSREEELERQAQALLPPNQSWIGALRLHITESGGPWRAGITVRVCAFAPHDSVCYLPSQGIYYKSSYLTELVVGWILGRLSTTNFIALYSLETGHKALTDPGDSTFEEVISNGQ